MTKPAVAWAFMAALAAAPALAQTPNGSADPIGDLLAKQPIPDEPDEAAERPQPPSRDPAPRTVRPPAVPNGLSDAAYDARILASSASAQRFQGPLDGGWVLSAADGDLYALQLSDRGRGPVEGAWRDLKRPGATAASGFVDEVAQTGPDLTLRFAGLSAVLHPNAGRWEGELTGGDGRRPVTLRRKP